MKVHTTELPGVLVIEPDVYRDDRGYFLETFRAERYAAHDIPTEFVQDSLSWSREGVLRGLHLQWPHAQGKLVSVLSGAVFDVAVDLRRDAETFGRWTGHVLSAQDARQMWIPPGFAHGFLVTQGPALFAYKSTHPYDPESELDVRWDDPAIGIDWPSAAPRLSAKDATAPLLATIDPARLPRENY